MQRVMNKIYKSAVQPLLPAVIDEVIQMSVKLRYFPNVWKPRTFNEKIAHRKLFTNDSRFSRLSDKWAVRDYVRNKIGDEYLIPVYQCVTHTSDIILSELPNEFVIKATHDSGSVIMVDDKSKHDWEKTFDYLDLRLQESYGVDKNEYWYSNITPRLLIEERMKDETYNVPLDFKLFVFHGSVKVIQLIQRSGSVSQRFYDRAWQPLSVRRPGTRIADLTPAPRQLAHMIEVAETLGEKFDFVRVDLYAPNDERVIFGEMTFSPAAGRKPFIPRRFDWELGAYW